MLMKQKPERRRPERRGAVWLRAVAALAAWCLATSAATAVEKHVIFLIDQSGSMWRAHGPDDSWPPNDREDRRIDMVAYTFDSLDRHLASRRNPNESYVIHVVEFAGRVRRHGPFTLSFDPLRSSHVVQNFKQLINVLKTPQGIDDGQTDTRRGLAEVVQLIGGLRQVPGNQVYVLLITDGKPYVEAGGINIANRPEYVQEMTALANTITGGGAHFDVIGLIGPANRDRYWDYWGSFWSRVSSPNTTYGVEDETEIVETVDEILHKWFELPPAQRVGNPFVCPPYLESVTFTVFRKVPDAQVAIYDANGRLLEDHLPDVTIQDDGRTYLRITVENPLPGLWELDRDASSIQYESFYQQIQRLEPIAPASVGDPRYFRYQVLSGRGQSFREDPRYPITTELGVTEADGISYTVSLQVAEGGIFASANTHALAAEGSAQLALRATTILPENGEEAEVFRYDELLAVTANELLVLAAGTSLPRARKLWFTRLKFEPQFAIERFNATGQTVPLSQISSRPGELVELRLVFSDGRPLDGVEWQKLTVSESGELVTTVATRVPLTLRNWLLREKRDLFVEVRIDDQVVNEGMLIREVKRDALPALIDRTQASPTLLNSPLAVPLVVQEGLVSYLLTWILLLGTAYLLWRLLRAGSFLLGDKLRRQTVKVVIQPRGGSDYEGTTKYLTGRRAMHFRKPARVQIAFGDDPDKPDWEPRWLKITRLFRPWTGRVVVKLTYPVMLGAKDKAFSTILLEEDRPKVLDGMSKAEAYLEVRRRGRLASDQLALWQD